MLWLTAVFTFVFGTVIGSFLNAALWRMRTRESIVTGRSHCTCCNHVLAPKDLIPVVSWLLLRGKCRYCRAGIHPFYIMVEVAVGVLFLLAARQALLHGTLDNAALARLLLHWYFMSALTMIFVYDLRYMLIPRALTFPATLIAIAGGLALGAHPFNMAVAIIVGAGVFWVQYAVSKGKWVGGGDIHLGALMGAMLGWPLVLVALFFAYFSGALYGGALLATRKTSWQSQIPFGTFLTTGTVVALLWGNAILAWYLHLTFR